MSENKSKSNEAKKWERSVIEQAIMNESRVRLLSYTAVGTSEAGNDWGFATIQVSVPCILKDGVSKRGPWLRLWNKHLGGCFVDDCRSEMNGQDTDCPF